MSNKFSYSHVAGALRDARHSIRSTYGSSRCGGPIYGIDVAIVMLVKAFKAENPNFDVAAFIDEAKS